MNGTRYLTLVLLWVSASVFGQATIGVPGDAPTIQAAIAAAQGGDTILVAPGNYNESGLSFLGKSIIVRADQGPSLTVINIGPSAVFQFVSGEGPESVLDGFSMINGSATAIVINGASPTILNCNVSGLSATAVTIDGSATTTPTFEDCSFTAISGTVATLNGGSPIFDRCTFTSNSSFNTITSLTPDPVTIRDSEFVNNLANATIDVLSNPIVPIQELNLIRCRFEGNTINLGNSVIRFFSGRTLEHRRLRFRQQ